jgi:hypothetical protein
MLEEQQMAGNLITFLQTLRRQWALYVGSDDPEVVSVFMHGMARAFFISGYRDVMPMRDIIRDTLFEESGWNSAGSLIDQMRAAGMDNSAIIDELIRVEIEAVKRRVSLQAQNE